MLFRSNAFSPELASNNENKTQCVYGKCIQSMTFCIYSRWGEKLFESSSQDNCWDGTFNGKPVNSDVYRWTLKAILIDGTTVNKTGDVTLFR